MREQTLSADCFRFSEATDQFNGEQAEKYARSLLQADPLADAVVAAFRAMPTGMGTRMLEVALEQGIESVPDAPQPLRDLVATLVERAREALAEGRGYLVALTGHLSSDCAFIVDLIVAIYEAVLDKIEASNCDPMARRHYLTDEEKLEIVGRLARPSAQPLRSNLYVVI